MAENCWVSCDSGSFDPKATSVVQQLMMGKPKPKLDPNSPIFTIGVVNDNMENFADQKRLGSDKPGYAVEIARLICDQSHLRCQFYVQNSSDHGVLRNGNWTGMLGSVYNGAVNTSLPTYLITSERLANFSFSDPATTYTQYLVTRRPLLDEVVSLKAFVNPLNWKIWLTILMTLVALTVVIRFLQSVRFTPGQRKAQTIAIGELIESSLFVFINISVYLVRKGPVIKRLARPTKLLLMTWGLGALVIMASYTGGLLSAMFKTQVKLQFTDLTTMFNCIEQQQCKMVISPEDEWILDLMTDPSSRYHPLKVILASNPYLRVGSYAEGLRLIQSTASPILVTPPADKKFVESQLRHKCSVAMVKDEVDYHFPFTLGSPTRDLFNLQLKNLRKSGILKKLISRYPIADECGQPMRKATAPPVPLRLGLGAIVIWLFGLLMAGAILLGEYLASRL